MPKEDPMPARPRPTVIEVAPRKPAGRATTPTVMPGSTPVRLVVDRDRLQRLDPKAGAATLACAEAILSNLIPAHLTNRQALFWAQDLQEEHGRLVGDHLDLMRHPQLRQVPAHLQRLQSLLMRFDLQAMTAKAGLLAGVFRAASGVIDTPAELQAARAEIDHLLHLLSGAMEGLADLKSRLDLRAAKLADLGNRVEAATLAAAYLAEAAPGPLTHAFAERRGSLAATLIHIRSAEFQHVQQSSLPARLVLAIQNLALVALPAWLERLAHFQAKLERGTRPSLTEARDLTFRLTNLIPLFPQME